MSESSSPRPIDLESILNDPQCVEYHRMLEEYVASQPHKPTGFSQDLDYTHERLYRAVSDMVVGNQSSRKRLDNAQCMLTVLRLTDWSPPMKNTFQSIMTTPAEKMNQADAEDAVRQLVQLFLDLSEQVINFATLGNQYEEAAWCVMQAKEGRPELLRHFMATHKKLRRELPAVVNEFVSQRAKKLLEVHQGRQSLHPARVIAIARLVHERLEFRDANQPHTSLNQACTHIGSLLGKSKEAIKSTYLSVYHS